MDSCHLFNFLFGTKRATTELSKCFSSMSQRAGARPSQSSDNGQKCQDKSDRNGNQKSAPPSPLRQLQMRIANFASTAKRTTTSSDQTKLDGCSQAECGTYRATLVQSATDSGSDEDDETQIDNGPPIAQPTVSREQSSTLRGPDHDKEPGSLVDCNKGQDPTSINNRGTSINSVTQSATVKPLQPVDLRSEDINQTDCSNSLALQSDKLIKTCKRVVLYDDQTLRDTQSQHRKIVSSAEVYNIVSEFGEARAKLRRVSLLSNDGGEICEDIQTQDKENRRKEKEEEDKSSSLEELLSASLPSKATCESSQYKRSAFVQSLVQSIELNGNFYNAADNGERRSSGPNSLNNNDIEAKSRRSAKPVLLVKSLPPKTPPKSNKAKCLNIQIGLNKPIKIQQLFQDESFLKRFFSKLEPLDRCKAAQVCRLWRNLLYSNQDYWKGLVNVIDCTQLRREYLVDCIISTLHTAKLKQQQQQRSKPLSCSHKVDCTERDRISPVQAEIEKRSLISSLNLQQVLGNDNELLLELDQEDVWRIQELCNRFAQRSGHPSTGKVPQPVILDANNNIATSEHQQQQTTTSTSKSSSIPSQISSTLSSVSLSSLLSPLSESGRIDSLKEKLYNSLDCRGFDAICLFGATDDDLEDLVNKMPIGAHRRITAGRLNNCAISDRGLSLFVSTFNQIEELEMTGCNEISNSFDLKPLTKLTRLIITDCINIADGLAQKLVEIVHQLEELTIQAYHLTDAFLEYLSLNSDTSKLRRLELPNCKEITNQSLIIIAKHFAQLETLSISGSSRISDEGIEILAEQSRKLISLDLSWCSRITDASLECIACDLADTMTDLILDRNVHITDIGLGYLATMSRLTLLHIRWCPRISDVGLESVIANTSLRYLSIAGLHQVTARSLLCLVDADRLLEVELTNCPAVNGELLMFLSTRMPRTNIIF